VSPRHRDIEDDHIGPGAGGEIDQRAAVPTDFALWMR
jgi:hypothetical protein